MTTTLYATLESVRARIDVEEASDDGVILEHIEEASRALDDACGSRKFYPRLATLNFNYLDPFCLVLDQDLLSITTLTTSNDGGSGTEVTSSQYWLQCGESNNIQPYDRVVINRSTTAEFDYVTTPYKSQQVLGVWGFHDDYSNAHRDSGDTVQNTTQITAGGTSLTVSKGANFETGQTLLIESEWLYVSRIAGDSLTVERGLNGSTAATHANGTAISIYEPMRDVTKVARRFAMWLYKQNESPFEFEISTGDNSFIIPRDAPPEVHRFVKRYRRTH